MATGGGKGQFWSEMAEGFTDTMVRQQMQQQQERRQQTFGIADQLARSGQLHSSDPEIQKALQKSLGKDLFGAYMQQSQIMAPFAQLRQGAIDTIQAPVTEQQEFTREGDRPEPGFIGPGAPVQDTFTVSRAATPQEQFQRFEQMGPQGAALIGGEKMGTLALGSAQVAQEKWRNALKSKELQQEMLQRDVAFKEIFDPDTNTNRLVKIVTTPTGDTAYMTDIGEVSSNPDEYERLMRQYSTLEDRLAADPNDKKAAKQLAQTSERMEKLTQSDTMVEVASMNAETGEIINYRVPAKQAAQLQNIIASASTLDKKALQRNINTMQQAERVMRLADMIEVFATPENTGLWGKLTSATRDTLATIGASPAAMEAINNIIREADQIIAETPSGSKGRAKWQDIKTNKGIVEQLKSALAIAAVKMSDEGALRQGEFDEMKRNLGDGSLPQLLESLNGLRTSARDAWMAAKRANEGTLDMTRRTARALQGLPPDEQPQKPFPDEPRGLTLNQMDDTTMAQAAQNLSQELGVPVTAEDLQFYKQEAEKAGKTITLQQVMEVYRQEFGAQNGGTQ